ncbi:MAG: DUF6879 family protein [Candidatus Micrarchaeales archaeon]
MSGSFELSSTEYGVELGRLMENAKSQAFRFCISDRYSLSSEKELIENFSKSMLSTDVIKAHFVKEAELASRLVKNNVDLKIVQLVNIPLSDYIYYAIEKYRFMQSIGIKVYFIERYKFDHLQQPGGIQICDLDIIDDKVLLARYKTEGNQHTVSGGLLITENDIYSKYIKLKEEILKAAVPMDNFLDTLLEKRPVALTEHRCPKCGGEKALLLFFGVIRGDEEPLTMFKCTSCGAVSREGFSH